MIKTVKHGLYELNYGIEGLEHVDKMPKVRDSECVCEKHILCIAVLVGAINCLY